MPLNALIPTIVQPFNLGNSLAQGIKVGNALFGGKGGLVCASPRKSMRPLQGWAGDD